MRIGWALVAALAGCGSSKPAAPDSAPIGDSPPAPDTGIDANPLEPATLAGTGLCLDDGCTQISTDVQAYTPQFPLWSDAATKRRWIYLPPSTQIDTSDMDHWVFPQGTKIWKEFTSGGIRVETRYIAKVGPGSTSADWYYMAYAWNATQDATTAVPAGVMNANGTQHDIPSRIDCKTCHENLQPTRVLGFGAIQLDVTPQTGEIALGDLIASNRLTVPPTGTAPYFALPAGTTDADNALGYLHANCGHCHNPTSQVYQAIGVQMQLRLTVGSLGSLSTTPPYLTAVGQTATQTTGAGYTTLVAAGDPDHSVLIYRFESTDAAVHMPALGSEVLDATADTTLRSWITNIPP